MGRDEDAQDSEKSKIHCKRNNHHGGYCSHSDGDGCSCLQDVYYVDQSPYLFINGLAASFYATRLFGFQVIRLSLI